MRWRPLAVSLLFAAATPAFADTVIAVDAKSPGSVSHLTISLAPAGFRSESGPTVTIFRPERSVLYETTPSRHRYVSVTPEKLRKAAVDFDAARQKWPDQLAGMPEARRQSMAAAFGPATATSASPLVFEATSLTASFGTWHCRMLHVMLEGVQHGAVCVLPLAEAGLSEADLPVLRQLTAFMQQGPRPLGGLASFWDLAAIAAAAGQPAFPVETIVAVPSGWMEYTVRSIARQPAPADAFDLPAGMTEEATTPRSGG